MVCYAQALFLLGQCVSYGSWYEARISLVQQRAAEVNRLQKVLEGANIKLSSVATDIMGVSGRANARTNRCR